MKNMATPGSTMILGAGFIILGVFMIIAAERLLIGVPFFFFGVAVLIQGLYMRKKARKIDENSS
jgi:hypothetical protein